MPILVIQNLSILTSWYLAKTTTSLKIFSFFWFTRSWKTFWKSDLTPWPYFDTWEFWESYRVDAWVCDCLDSWSHGSLFTALSRPHPLLTFIPIWVSYSSLVSGSFSLPPCFYSCVTSISPTLSHLPSHLHPAPFHLYLNPPSLLHPYFHLYFSLYPFAVNKKTCNLYILGFTVWLKSHLHIHPNLNGSTHFPPQCNALTCFWD